MKQEIKDIQRSLSQLMHPLTNEKLDLAKDVVDLRYEDDKLTLSFAFPKGHTKAFSTFQRSLLKALKQDLHIPKIQLNYLNPEHNLPEVTTSPMATTFPHARFFALYSTTEEPDITAQTVALAQALRRVGKKVAIIDGAIAHPAVPTILGMHNVSPQNDGLQLKPFIQDDIQVISTGLLTQDKKPMVWRAEMIKTIFSQFLYDVAWHPTTDIFLFNLAAPAEMNISNLSRLLGEIQALPVSAQLASTDVTKLVERCIIPAS